MSTEEPPLHTMSTEVFFDAGCLSDTLPRRIASRPERCAAQGAPGRQARQHHLRGYCVPVPGLIPAVDSLWPGCADGVHGRAARGIAEWAHRGTVPRDE